VRESKKPDTPTKSLPPESIQAIPEPQPGFVQKAEVFAYRFM